LVRSLQGDNGGDQRRKLDPISGFAILLRSWGPASLLGFRQDACRLDHDTGQPVFPPSQKADDLPDVVRQALLRHDAVGIVNNRDNAVVGMQINPAVHRLRLLVAKGDSVTPSSP
jgi:hypothetical protein